MSIDSTVSYFAAVAGAGVVLMIVGGRLRSFARAQEREQGGVQVMAVKRDDTDQAQDAAVVALQAEISTLQIMVPDLPATPARWVDYDGWFEEVLKRVRIRSQQRTADEQIKLRDRVVRLQKQYLEVVKTRYEIEKTNYEIEETRNAFGRLKGKASKDDDQLQAEHDEIRVRRKEAEVRMAELDQKLKEIREGKPQVKETENDPIQKRIAHVTTSVRTSAGLRAAGAKLKEEYPDDADFIDREIRKAIAQLREGS